MTARATALAVLGSWLASFNVGWTQEAADTQKAAEAESPRQSMQRRFDEASPAVGQPLPDVSGYDIDGNPLSLAALKGHYSVIVFGCLT